MWVLWITFELRVCHMLHVVINKKKGYTCIWVAHVTPYMFILPTSTLSVKGLAFTIVMH